MYYTDCPVKIDSLNDHFNLYPKVEGMINFLGNVHAQEALKKNNLVALYGEWGSGKSSIVETVKSELDDQKFKSFIFEAWKYEKDDNLTFSIFEAVMDNIVGTKDAVVNIVKEGVLDGLKSFASGLKLKTPIIDMDIGEMRAKSFEKSLYTKINNFLEEFKKILNKYSEGKKIVVFIDDLDRCEDENIINLLISLKLMFALEGIIFVCCIDKEATTEALERKYNNNIKKAESFLDKLFIFDFNILHSQESIYSKEKITVDNKELLFANFAVFSIKNPRKINKIENKIKMLKPILEPMLEGKSENEKIFFIYTIYFLITYKEYSYFDFFNFFNKVMERDIKCIYLENYWMHNGLMTTEKHNNNYDTPYYDVLELYNEGINSLLSRFDTKELLENNKVYDCILQAISFTNSYL